MRQQLALLKKKLDKEEVVNERLLRETMHGKAAIINHEAMWSIIAAIFVIVMMISCFRPMGFSLAFCIGTSVYMLICIGGTLYQHRNVNKRNMNGDLLTVAKIMRRLKKNYRDWLKFSIPVTVIWFCWMGYDLYRQSGEWKLVCSMMIGAVVGGLIGGYFGIKSYKKVLRTADEIINSIEMEEEE